MAEDEISKKDVQRFRRAKARQKGYSATYSKEMQEAGFTRVSLWVPQDFALIVKAISACLKERVDRREIERDKDNKLLSVRHDGSESERNAAIEAFLNRVGPERQTDGQRRFVQGLQAAKKKAASVIADKE